MRKREFILLFAILNASLYSCCLPLWEGFDEAFHHAYLETLWQTGKFPVLGRTLVPVDIFQSFSLAPVGPVVHTWVPIATTYDSWFRLPAAEKERRRSELERLRPVPENSQRPNYEAHQAPLAYLLLALVDRQMTGFSLPLRVLVLRLFAAVGSILMVYFGSVKLSRLLSLSKEFTNALLLTIFCTQMLYATVAHVANDWLAVGVNAMLLASFVETMACPNARRVVVSVLWLAAALLTKAYFLPMVILIAIVPRKWIVPACLFLLVLGVGPWYARNLLIYHNLTGTYEEFEGIGIGQTLAAAKSVDWPSVAAFQARGALWTGNASFTTFSRGTLDTMLGFLLAAMLAWGIRWRLIQAAEKLMAAIILVFSAAIAYASCAAFVHMHGDSPGASPWYTQLVLVPVLLLAYLGMSRSGSIGRYIGIGITALWTWTWIATWVVKLFPMYSGAPSGPLRFRELWAWYTQGMFEHSHDFTLLALTPAPAIYVGMILSVVGSLVLAFLVIQAVGTGHRPLPAEAASQSTPPTYL
jgi:hypothetical protein